MGDPPDRLGRGARLESSDSRDRHDHDDTRSDAPAGARTVLKFDAGRRGFGRAIVALSIAAIVLLGFSLVFLWPVLSRSFG